MGEGGGIPKSVTTAAFAAFISLGAVQSSYGPSILHIVERFHVSVATAGLVVTAHFLGSFFGTAAFGLSHSRLSLASRLGAGALMLAGGLVLATVAPVWPLVLAAIAIAGVGYGGLGISVNVLFVTGYGKRSAAMLILVNAAFGVGSFLGPALVGMAEGYAFVWTGTAVAALACSPWLWRSPTPVATLPRDAHLSSGRTNRVVVAFVALMFAYMGVDAGVGTWEPAYLVAAGWSSAFAAGATSLFWGAYTLGRLAGAPLISRLAPQRVLFVSLTAAVLLLAGLRAHVYPPLTFGLIGLAIMPVIPVTLIWLTRLVPNTASAVTHALLGLMLGSALLPAALGAFIARFGIQSLPIGIVGCALASLAMVGLITVMSQHERSVQAPAA